MVRVLPDSGPVDLVALVVVSARVLELEGIGEAAAEKSWALARLDGNERGPARAERVRQTVGRNARPDHADEIVRRLLADRGQVIEDLAPKRFHRRRAVDEIGRVIGDAVLPHPILVVDQVPHLGDEPADVHALLGANHFGAIGLDLVNASAWHVTGNDDLTAEAEDAAKPGK